MSIVLQDQSWSLHSHYNLIISCLYGWTFMAAAFARESTRRLTWRSSFLDLTSGEGQRYP